jgi:O-6-methylguanine DNA methyltransferase
MYKSSFKDKVFVVVSRIPCGQTLSYKEVAKLAGRPKAYRAVGNILHRNPHWPKVPCHRVIRSDGKIGGWAGGAKKKALLLKKEGFLKSD